MKDTHRYNGRTRSSRGIARPTRGCVPMAIQVNVPLLREGSMNKFNNLKSTWRPTIYRKARVLRFNNQNRYSFSNSAIFLARYKFNSHRLYRALVKFKDLVCYLDNKENEMISILSSILSQSSFPWDILFNQLLLAFFYFSSSLFWIS